MSDPVILLGTQSNGETLPVQVDEFGRLVAEGLQGPEGPPGPPGIGQLPPDPWEGALLGWLNGELAWIGSPPVPIPEDVFGPIVQQIDEGQVVVEGQVPVSVVNGVYLTQVNAQGELSVPGENLSRMWSDGTTQGSIYYGRWSEVFNGVRTDTYNDGNSVYVYRKSATLYFDPPLPTGVMKVWAKKGSNRAGTEYVQVSDGSNTYTTGPLNNETAEWITLNNGASVSGITSIMASSSGSSDNGCVLGGISINDEELVNNDLPLQLRVNNVVDNIIIGVSTRDKEFSPGEYLKVPETRIAPWVLRGVDPTSDIDLLRTK